MTIVKKPKSLSATEAAKEKFIAGAPDAGQAHAPEQPATTGVMRGSRRQIALTFPPATIDQIDATAKRFGMTRAGYINRAVVQALEADGN